MATQTVPLTEARILHAYWEKTPRSRALDTRAGALNPGHNHPGFLAADGEL